MFIAITSRSCNGSAVRIKLSKPSGKIWLNWNWTKTKRKNPLDHCATLPRIKLGGKLLYSKYYFREILPTDAVWSWWSYIYHEFKDILFAVVAVNFPPSSPPPLPPPRTGYSSHDISDISSSWICQKHSHYSVYHNQNHIHSHQVKCWQRGSPQGLASNSEPEATWMTEMEFIHLLRR